MLKKYGMIAILLALIISGCGAKENVNTEELVKSTRMGILPPQTQALVDEEWQVYRAKHPDVDEQTARHDFDVIQAMSAVHYDTDTAIWAERRAYANAWLKTTIEKPFSKETLTDDVIQLAIDAYAFDSGTPALVTASHILIKPDKASTAEERRAALEAVRKDLLEKGVFTNEALAEAAQRLSRAGYLVDMDPDLTFPDREMVPFLDEQLRYQNVVEPFSKAAFALNAKNPLSQVTESEFGYHLILFRSMKEERKADINRDREFLSTKIIEKRRLLEAKDKIAELMQSGKILIDEDRLKEIAGGKTADTENKE
ncbi:MAG: peptidylprolyl isomerase [Proteobacteria bacterium]|nr:peptidylprolyl isomerase [Pseudomonadota bacterium]